MKAKGLLLTAACLLLAGSTFAQQKLTPRLTVNVPFDFVVNDDAMPKGEYIVSTFDDGRKLLIQNKTQAEYSAYVLNTDVSLGRPVESDGRLIFILTDGQHALHQITLRGDNHIHDIVHQGHDETEIVAQR